MDCDQILGFGAPTKSCDAYRSIIIPALHDV